MTEDIESLVVWLRDRAKIESVIRGKDLNKSGFVLAAQLIEDAYLGREGDPDADA